MRKWLARLSFSFLIIAIAVAWETLRGSERGWPRWRVYLQFTLAAACAVLAVAGIRARHRTGPDD